MAKEKTPLKWMFKTGGSVASSPLLVNDVVYFGSGDNYKFNKQQQCHLYAVDIKTGKEKWKFETGGAVTKESPTLVDGVVYFGSRDNHLYAVDVKTGKEKWKFKMYRLVESSPAIAEGVIYFGSIDKHLYAVDIEDGKEKWKFETGGEVYSPAVSDGVVYFGSHDNHLYALDAKTGEEKWKFGTGGYVTLSPAVVDGIVYFGNENTYIFALDVSTGEEKWKFFSNGCSISPAVSDDIVYFGVSSTYYNNHLYALDAKTGKEKWKFKAGAGRLSSEGLSIVNGIVYFGSWDNHLYAVDINTGEKNWKFAVTGRLSSPAVVDGVVYFGSGGDLYAVDIEVASAIGKEEQKRKEDADTDGITVEDIRTKYISDEITLEEAIELQDQYLETEQKEKELELKRKEEDIKLKKQAEKERLRELDEWNGNFIKKRDLIRVIWDKVVDDLSDQSYETEVSHQQADNYERLEEDKYDYAIDDEPCPCGSGKNYEDCDGVEKVRIPSGEYIMEDEEFDKEFFNYVNTDELGSGVLSKKEIEDWIDESVPSLCRSYESVSIGQGDDRMYLSVESLYYSLEDLNPEWTDDEYGIDDEKMEYFINTAMEDW